MPKSNSNDFKNPLMVSLFILILGSLFYLTIDALTPFVIALFIAYFFAPLFTKLSNFFSKNASAAILALLFVALVLIIFFSLAPIFITQLNIMAEQIGKNQEIIDQAARKINSFISHVDLETQQKIKQEISKLSSHALNFIVDLTLDIFASGKALLNIISIILLTPIIFFYVMRDWPSINGFIDKAIPRKHYKKTKKLLNEINETLAGYVRGQALVCILLAIYYAITLSIIGVESSLAIGILSGIFTVIPYIGAIFSCCLSVLVAALQFGFTIEPLIVLLIYIIGQTIEGYYIVPKFIGNKINLSAIWIMLGLVVCGALFGFAGILVALPLTAVSGVLVRYCFKAYLKTSFYTKQI